MAAAFPEDDDFNWEAAVAEIDEACRRSAECSVTNPGLCKNPYTRATRQQTLDCFVTQTRQSTHNDADIQDFSNLDELQLGIDPVAATSWIYPANVSRRDYQFDITKTALFANTIVSLPTGLGKTLIAAVVMYNFFRWFPEGKIVFTAPSRPLVLQQIEACHNIMGIPQAMTIDMTGQISPTIRAEFWRTRRVFFVTPQVLEKDMQSGTCPKQQITCLVIDEAHRASGNYSYCVVVRELMATEVKLRILALTATPGSNQATIQAVVDNLQISCLEYRSDTDPDVCRYIHDRQIEIVQVTMNREMNQVRDMFLEVMQPMVNKLVSLGVFYSRDYARLTPFEFLTARDKFRQAPPAALNSRYGEVEAHFGAAITLYHVFKLLFSHGTRPAFEMLQQKLEQPGPFSRMMGRNEKLLKIKQIMQQSVRHGAPSPKLEKLEQILLNHFKLHDPGETRVIIFTNFRESVKDIMEALAKQQGTVKAMEFIGQSSGKSSKGQTQKMQQAVLQKFRAGGYNTIVATSIAEEGLDIMEVDLVICFDANVSPLRMIQRMGRTGRKRDGRVVVLASEGPEMQGYLKKQARSQALGKHLHNGGLQSFNFHPSPRMIPHRYRPEVQLVEMSIETFVPRSHKQKVDAGIEDPAAAELTTEECAILQKYSNSLMTDSWNPSLIAFPRFQLVPTPIYRVKHSFRTTSMLIETLQKFQEPSQQSIYKCSAVVQEAMVSQAEQAEQDLSAWHGLRKDDLESWPKAVDEEPWAMQEEAFEPFPLEPMTSPVSMKTDVTNQLLECSYGMENSKILREVEENSVAKHHIVEGKENLPYLPSPVQTDNSHNSPDAPNVRSEVPKIPFTNASPVPGIRPSLHRCFFSKGAVSLSATGNVIVATPPRLSRRATETSAARDFDEGNCAPQVCREGDAPVIHPTATRAEETFDMEPESPSRETSYACPLPTKEHGILNVDHVGKPAAVHVSRLSSTDTPFGQSMGGQFFQPQVLEQLTSPPIADVRQNIDSSSCRLTENQVHNECNRNFFVPSSVMKEKCSRMDLELLDELTSRGEHEMEVSPLQAGHILSPSSMPGRNQLSVSRRQSKAIISPGAYHNMGVKLPETELLQDKSVDNGSMKSHSQSRSPFTRRPVFPDDFSPRLTNLAEQGMVPVSPGRNQLSMSRRHTSATETPGAYYNMGVKLSHRELIQGNSVDNGTHPVKLFHSLSRSPFTDRPVFLDDFSPRLTNLAEQGMVPVSPALDIPVKHDGVDLFWRREHSTPRGVFKQDCSEINARLPLQSDSIELPNRTNKYNARRSTWGLLTPEAGTHSLRSSVQRMSLAGDLSPIQPKTLQFYQANPVRQQVSANSKRTPSSSQPQDLIPHLSVAEKTTPNLKQASSEERKCQSTIPPSVQKRRKFKRLRKVGELQGHDPGSKEMSNLSVREQIKETRSPNKVSGLSKSRHQKNLLKKKAVQPFVDDEAEVSSSQECSADEDDSEEMGSLQHFIDDRTTPSQQPQVTSIDMMAVYRRSLLTPSPAQPLVGSWLPLRSPSTDGTHISSSFHNEDSATGCEDSADKAQPMGSVIETPTFHAISMAESRSAVRSSACSDTSASGLEKSWTYLPEADGEVPARDGKIGRLEPRKRKLSFQADAQRTAKQVEDEQDAMGSVVPDPAKNAESQAEQRCLYLEEDVFAGLDLDALEAEAVEQSRVRLATQHTASQLPAGDGLGGGRDLDSQINSCKIINLLTLPKQNS